MPNSQAANEDEKKYFQALKDHPDLKACFLEMIAITEDTTNQLNLGDEAEDAVIQVMRKTGATLLKEWAQRKAVKAEQETRELPGVRVHEKKN